MFLFKLSSTMFLLIHQNMLFFLFFFFYRFPLTAPKVLSLIKLTHFPFLQQHAVLNLFVQIKQVKAGVS